MRSFVLMLVFALLFGGGLAATPLPGKAGFIVVLGAAQYNGKPSPIFQGRLEAAYLLYRQGTAPKVVATGGRRSKDRFSEGEVGCDYLARLGVPKTALLCETTSASTWENLANIRPVVGSSLVVIVTDEPHLPRALLIAEKLGIKATGYAVKGSFKTEYYQRERWLRLLVKLGFFSGGR